MSDDLPESAEEWREELSPEAYRVLRERGTEPRGSGDLLHVEDDGVYRCAGCGQALFDSTDKFDSGTGWPSFADVKDSDAVALQRDDRGRGTRTEVLCSNCGGHLGHVFQDGPEPTGKRYCVNSVALEFESAD